VSDAVVIDLVEQRNSVAEPEALARGGRSARTLLEAGPGDLLSAPAGVTHALSSVQGAAFLLTLALPTAAEEPRERV
jgi:hypothetical protein